MAPSALVGIANLPNQRHRIVSRKGANFTMMVVGESGLGKTTFVNTLFTTLMREYKRPEHRFQKQLERTVQIDVVRSDIEEKGFNVRLTVIDTPGFGDYVNNQDCWVPIVEYIDEQHLNHMKSEQRADRKTKDDMRIHVCLYFIQPTGHTLRPLDIEVMRQLGARVNLIPVIAKADTMTPSDMALFKDRVRDCISTHDIKVYSPPVQSDDEDNTRRNQSILSAMPFSVIASETDVPVNGGEKVRGRQYLWGVAEVENENHCDFKKLRNLLIRTHMHDLITSTEELHYENFRMGKLTSEGHTDDGPAIRAKRQIEVRMKDEEEALRKRFTEQVRMEENRFRQWEQRLIAERDRLNKDLESQHKQVKALEEDLDELVQRRK
ncbi:Septin-domain-containing protein [Gaertneriomyces semiglobifer]|nr:Septin-domain-containing protein [Gaertneriomyces semiglobifer]